MSGEFLSRNGTLDSIELKRFEKILLRTGEASAGLELERDTDAIQTQICVSGAAMKKNTRNQFGPQSDMIGNQIAVWSACPICVPRRS